MGSVTTCNTLNLKGDRLCLESWMASHHAFWPGEDSNEELHSWRGLCLVSHGRYSKCHSLHLCCARCKHAAMRVPTSLRIVEYQ